MYIIYTTEVPRNLAQYQLQSNMVMTVVLMMSVKLFIHCLIITSILYFLPPNTSVQKHMISVNITEEEVLEVLNFLNVDEATRMN